ncbi:hypothetical protein BB561_006584, partial [Smittium simulii]
MEERLMANKNINYTEKVSPTEKKEIQPINTDLKLNQKKELNELLTIISHIGDIYK